jgi:hypothetical protein
MMPFVQVVGLAQTIDVPLLDEVRTVAQYSAAWFLFAHDVMLLCSGSLGRYSWSRIPIIKACEVWCEARV